MSEQRRTLLDKIEGLKPVDPKALEKFDREMTERVIPGIIEDAAESAILAAESRFREMEVRFEKRKRD
jgi:hypothetical protein